MEESPEGDVTFEDIRDKTFRHIVDEQFKFLHVPTIFKSDDLRQKLMLMGTETFNTLLGTKIFRREFLIKNSLRFNENVQADVELPFVVNAVMFSEEIIFMPDLLYVARQK